jgi:hypothetical protein
MAIRYTRTLAFAAALVPAALVAACQMPTEQQLAAWGLLGAGTPQPTAGWPTSAEQPGVVVASQPAPAGQPASVPRDAQLVGSWTRSESFGAGSEYGGALRESLEISGDGTFVLGPGEFAGGGPGVSGGSYGGGAQATGQWATADGIVYVGDGSSGWEAYARYYLEAGKLMFTFGDGSRQIWYRR